MEIEVDLGVLCLVLAILVWVILTTVIVVYLVKKKKSGNSIILIVYEENEKKTLGFTQQIFQHLEKKVPEKEKGKTMVLKQPLTGFNAKDFNYGNGELTVLFVLSSSHSGKGVKTINEYLTRYPSRKFPLLRFSIVNYGVEKDGHFAGILHNELSTEIREALAMENVWYVNPVGDTTRQFRAWKGTIIRTLFPAKKSKKKKKKKKKPQKSAFDDDIEELSTHMLRGGLKDVLRKQRYTLVGSHSSVKLCRWVKNMLKGRGCCYKHTAYGISSYSCIQSTTSIACANKCVFCWRHGNNPVTKEWRWDADEPEELAEKFISTQVKLIKQFRTMPGMTDERFSDALTPKHVALSLIGESLLYPNLNKFLATMHKRNITSFLVTNAQFPEHFKRCDPVTQMYVSVSAPTASGFQKMTRPIFDDAWTRYTTSLKLLRGRKERTVLRFTLVKDFNMSMEREVCMQYAKLIEMGRPSFVELKGVTYCGTGVVDMSNVPFHSEVREFAERLYNQGNLADLGYELAIEHAHTCFIGIAHKRFKMKKPGDETERWYTWIDNDEWCRIACEKREEFCDTDYCLPTPEWALYGAKEKGYDSEFFDEDWQGEKKKELEKGSERKERSLQEKKEL